MTLDKPNGKESYLSSKHNMDKRSDSDDREEHKVKAKVKRGHGIKNMNMNMTGMTNMTGMGCIKNALIDNVGNVPDSILERLKVGKTTSNFSNLQKRNFVNGFLSKQAKLVENPSCGSSPFRLTSIRN